MSNASRKIKKAKAKARTTPYAERNCIVKGCNAIATSRAHCEICGFYVSFCPDHQPEAADAIHAHIVKKHFLIWFWFRLTGKI